MNTTNNQTKIYIIAAVILVVLILAVSLFLILYKPNNTQPINTTTTSSGEIVVPVKNDEAKMVLICGLDKSKTMKTDVMMVANINVTEKKISVVSLPRDIVVTKDASTLGELYGIAYEKALLTLGAGNEKTASKTAMEYLKTTVEGALDITIDDYALVSLDVFKTVVDNMGGIEFDVPQNMDYEDPYQGLSIHLTAGKQTLTGAQAEMLVRYKSGYTNDDLGRIDVVQNFTKALLNKALNNFNIVTLSGLVIPVLNDMTTSVDISKISNYMKILYEIKTVDNFSSQRLSGLFTPEVVEGGIKYNYYVNMTEGANLVYTTLNPTHRKTSEISFNKNGIFANSK